METVTNKLPCHNDNRSFFQKLQNAEGLDLRDNRGKRHDLAVVLVGVTLAVLSNRDGSLSSIHRHLLKHYDKLVEVLAVEKKRPVSRSQLPKILEKVSLQVFDQKLFGHYGIRFNEKEQKWFGIDGKELRGSIAEGEKRGEAIVQAVEHESQQGVGQTFYSGQKESEVVAVRQLFEQSAIASQKVSLDALHCKPKTLKLVTQRGGKYLVGLKENQKHLKKQILQQIEKQAILFKSSQLEKGHGRIERRRYEFYDLLEMPKDERWNLCQIKTLIKVKRERVQIRSGKKSTEESYYLSNEVGNYEELCKAVRGHWQVETANHVRDVSLKEDSLRSKKRIYNEQWQQSEHWQQRF